MVDIDIQHSRKKFEEDGFVILRGFIDPEQVEEIGSRAECVLAKRKEYAERYTNITKGLEKVDDYFDDLMNQGPQVAILTELLGTPPVPVTSSFFTKNKNSEEVHPHSDAMYGGVIWIAIDPTNRENGCLHFIRGSHLREEEFSYLRPHEPNDLSAHPDVVEAVMEPGDIVFSGQRPCTGQDQTTMVHQGEVSTVSTRVIQEVSKKTPGRSGPRFCNASYRRTLWPPSRFSTSPVKYAPARLHNIIATPAMSSGPP